jgi:hypothetical protein
MLEVRGSNKYPSDNLAIALLDPTARRKLRTTRVSGQLIVSPIDFHSPVLFMEAFNIFILQKRAFSLSATTALPFGAS